MTMKPTNRAPKILITGLPGSGKTTLVCRIAQDLANVRGFYTREIRKEGRRVGFSLNLLGGNELILAHVDIRSRYRVGKYGVDLGTFENAACPEVEAALKEGAVLVIDEIGKMELFSARFRGVIQKALDSPLPMLAAILKKPDPFADRVKARRDVELIELTHGNRDELVVALTGKLRPFDRPKTRGG